MSAGLNNASLEAFLSKLGIRPRDLGLFKDAFTHRSFLNETKPGGSSNERLEFLGDAVLGLLVSRFFYLRFPRMPEGRLAKAKAALVSEAALARWAGEVGLGSYLVLGKGEEKSGGREKAALLADCFEALLGALFLDQGLEAAAGFLEPFLEKEETPGKASKDDDAKTRLQEWAQSHYKQPPAYAVTKLTGPDHERRFEIEVSVKGRVLAMGAGKNKKEAEQAAASGALRILDDKSMV